MRQFESMLKLYHVLPSRSWITLQAVYEQCRIMGIECSSHTVRRWLKAWVAVGFVEEQGGGKEYQYRQSSHQPFVTSSQDTVLLHWLARYFAPLLPDELRRLLEHRLASSEHKLNQSIYLQQYLHHIDIELPFLPSRYFSTLIPLKHAMLNQRIIHCVFIGQSFSLLPQALVLNSQGWWLRYQVKDLNHVNDEITGLMIRSLLCLLWIEEG